MGEHFQPHRIPAHAHPLVRQLFAEMNKQRCPANLLATRSGLNPNTIKDWRTRTVPTVDNLDAALTVLGLRIVIRPIKEPK